MYNMTGAVIVLCVISAIVGWGAIEAAIWLFSHISLTWNW